MGGRFVRARLGIGKKAGFAPNAIADGVGFGDEFGSEFV
jgi:hypothetical protein